MRAAGARTFDLARERAASQQVALQLAQRKLFKPQWYSAVLLLPAKIVAVGQLEAGAIHCLVTCLRQEGKLNFLRHLTN